MIPAKAISDNLIDQIVTAAERRSRAPLMLAPAIKIEFVSGAGERFEKYVSTLPEAWRSYARANFAYETDPHYAGDGPPVPPDWESASGFNLAASINIAVLEFAAAFRAEKALENAEI